jgi:dTDP-4-amino-4,6-dideoxygalactose transaminase
MPGFELWGADERKEVNDVLETGILMRYGFDGPRKGIWKAKELEQAICEVFGPKYAQLVSSGTAALTTALSALGVGYGDEVIMPAFTFVASFEAVISVGAIPVFVDVDPKTFCIDPAKIEKAITSKTKAIVPVHLYGQASDMDAIMEIAKKHSLYVIEDNAQGIGSDYFSGNGTTQKLGTIGDIGCTSFFPSKNLGCYGDGGAIFTNNDELAVQLKMVANHGQKVKYQHDVVGCNSRLDAVQAAILNVKLPKLDEYIAARIKVADYYDRELGASEKIEVPHRDGKSKHVFHQYTVQLKGVDRNALQEYLASKDIPSMIYYPVPAHKQGMFQSFNLGDLDLPVTEELTKHVISFPIHTEMTEEQQALICTEILHFVNAN